MKLIKKYLYSGKVDLITARDPMKETRQRILDRLNNNTYYWIDIDGSLRKDYLTDEAKLEDYARKSGTVTPLNWEFNLLTPARLGLGTLTNGIKTGLQSVNTAFTPSTWLNPVTGTKLLSPTIGTIADAGVQGAFAYEGLNGLWNQGKQGTLLSDPASTFIHSLEMLPVASPLIKAGTKGVNAATNGIKTATKPYRLSLALNNMVARNTPMKYPSISATDVYDLTGGVKNTEYSGPPIFEFAQTLKTSPSRSYFISAPKDIDVMRLGNGRFRHEVVGNNILSSGEVDGKFVSYGEPWQEFALGSDRALYEFPVGSRRGPGLMATDWKGRPQDYSVDEILDYMVQERKFNEEAWPIVHKLIEQGKWGEISDFQRVLKDTKYPLLRDNRYPTDIQHGNQTVIPNSRWNFDTFLKTPFWKYSTNPESGQVQKELFMRGNSIFDDVEGARLDFLERNPSRISEAERAGVPKGDRNFKRTENPNGYMQQEANKSFDNINNHSPRRRLVTEEEIGKMSPEAQIHAREGKNDFIKRNQDMMEDYFADSYEFNKDLQDYINGLDIEIAPQFKPIITDGIAERNPYVAAYRNYLYNNGTDAMLISDDDIAKFLTHMHNMQQQGVTGKMANKLPLWHGSNDMFDIFDWHNTGKYTGNSGALGPGNYFSSHGATYGKLQRRNNLPKNFQPYYITGIESTPSGHMMINKGILPDYMGPQMFLSMKRSDPTRLEEILFRPVPGANTSLYIDSGEAVQGVLEGDRAAFMLRRNDGIKSLFPHPSRLIRNEDGTVQLLPTNWSDPRVNFALGGKLIKHIGK